MGVESVGCRVDGRRKRAAQHEHQAGRLGTQLHQYTLVLLDSPYQGMIAGAPQDRFPPLAVCHLDPSRVPSHGQSVSAPAPDRFLCFHCPPLVSSTTLLPFSSPSPSLLLPLSQVRILLPTLQVSCSFTVLPLSPAPLPPGGATRRHF